MRFFNLILHGFAILSILRLYFLGFFSFVLIRWIMGFLPRLSGSLFAGGMLIFCGTTYYHALTGDTQLRSAQVLNVTNSTGSEPQPPGGSTYLPMR